MTFLFSVQSRFFPFPWIKTPVIDTKEVLLLAGNRVSAYFSAIICIKDHSGDFVLPNTLRVVI